MDEQNDRRYSRSPKFKEVVDLCRSLNENGVAYLLIGGFAVNVQGGTRTTHDVDFLVNPSVENVRKIKKAMASLPDNAIALIEDDEVQKHDVVRIADEFVVDLLAKACGIPYEEAIQEIEYKVVDGVKIPVATKELLIRLKNTFRDKDKMDVHALLRLIEREKSGPEEKTPKKWWQFWKRPKTA